MKKRINISGMLKLGLVLSVFATAACVMLAFVYTGTAKIIAIRQQADLESALSEVFPGDCVFEPITEIAGLDTGVVILSQYAVMKSGEIAGAVLELSRDGFSGPIRILAGVSADGIVTGVKILEQSETPGLGSNAESSRYFVDKAKKITFYGQFAGKSAYDPFEVRNDVISISASTVTSRAIAQAVKAAAVSANEWFSGAGPHAISGASEGVDW